MGIKHHQEVGVKRSQWAKQELPFLGPRATKAGGKVGWASDAPGRSEQWKEEAGAGNRRGKTLFIVLDQET